MRTITMDLSSSYSLDSDQIMGHNVMHCKHSVSLGLIQGLQEDKQSKSGMVLHTNIKKQVHEIRELPVTVTAGRNHKTYTLIK